MTDFERVSTGLGEECGVFGAYDLDGHDEVGAKRS